MSGVAGCLSKGEKVRAGCQRVCVTEKCPMTAASVCRCVQGGGGWCIFRVGVSKEGGGMHSVCIQGRACVGGLRV